MSVLRFIIDKKTGLAIDSETLDGAGRGNFSSKYYNKTGNNPNVQLNYKLKPEYSSIDIGTNRDAFLDSRSGGGYVWSGLSESLWQTNVIKPITKYTDQIQRYNTLGKNKNGEIDPDLPDIFGVDENRYEDLYDLRNSIAIEQNKKIDELNLIDNPVQKQKAYNDYLPFYDEAYTYVTDRLTDFEGKVASERKKRNDSAELFNLDLGSEKNSLYNTPEKAKLKQLKETDKEIYVAEPASSKNVFIGYSDAAGQFSARYKQTPIYQIQTRAESYGSRYKPEYDQKINELDSQISAKIKSAEDSREFLSDPDLPELANYNNNSNYNDLLNLKELTLSERDKKIAELDMIEDPIQKYAAKEKELPQYYDYLNFASKKLVTAYDVDKDLPELSMFDDKTDYDTLYNFQDTIISEQNKKIEEINMIQDPVERFLTKEKELPQYDRYMNFANEKITNLDTRVANVRSTRKSNISFSEMGDTFTYNNLIDSRNTIAALQNEKVSQINLIQDPAERYVAIEQDFPVFSNKLNEYDEKINQYGNILETRNPVDIKFNRDRRGALEINIGDKQGKFRNTRRGFMEAENFYSNTKNQYIGDLSKQDIIMKNASIEQDVPLLDYGEKVFQNQKKIQRNQERQRLMNMNDVYVGDFGANAPSDTPTGTLRVPNSRPNIVAASGLDKIFGTVDMNFSGQNKRQVKNSISMIDGSRQYRSPKPDSSWQQSYKMPKHNSVYGDFEFNQKRQRSTKNNIFF